MRPSRLGTLALVLAGPLGLASLAGCDASAPVDPPDAPPPALALAVGTEWTLARTHTVQYDDAGRPEDTTATVDQTVTLAVTRDTVAMGETWFLVEPSLSGFGHCVFGRAAWYTNREDGLYRWLVGTDPELVYGVGLEPGDVFLDTDAFEARYLGGGTVELASGATTAAREYRRLWKRLDLNAEARGPISPQPATHEALSSELGPLALEVSYVRRSPEGAAGEASFQPISLVRYERVPGPAAAEARRPDAPAPDGIAVR